MRVGLVALALLFCALPAQAAELVVKDITVEGVRRVEQDAALRTLGLKAPATIDASQAPALIRRVWDTGFFEDVQLVSEPVEGGVRLVFLVVEKPSVREVRYDGHDNVSKDDIEGVVDVKPFTILNVDLIKRNVAKIKSLYVDEGHYLAEVDFRVEPVPDSPHEVDVVFEIVENAKVLVKRIQFVGNDNLTDDELKAVMQTREGNELSWFSQMGTYNEEFFQTDLFRIQALYYDNGFVAVKVGEPTASISADRRYIHVVIPITEGLQYDIGEITFSGDVQLEDDEGEIVVDEAKLREKLTIGSGELFKRSALFSDIQVLTDAYRDRGYAYANVTPNSKLNDESRTVDLDLVVERGEMVYFERIEIVGNTRTRDKVIRREMVVHEGDRYSSSGLNLSKARIFRLGYFETVDITTSRGSTPDRMNVEIKIKEKSTGTFQVGAGFSSVESFIATAQISQNNFLGQGWLLSLSMQLSFGEFARQLATFQFFDPYFLDTRWSFGLDAYIQQRLFPEFQRNARGFSPRIGYPITPDLRLSVGYTLEDIEIRNNSFLGAAQPALFQLNADGINSAVNLNLTYDTRDNRLFPSSGMYHVLTGELSDPLLGTSEALGYRRAELISRFYYPLFWQFVLKFNMTLGMVFGVDDRPAPISERFFPGGIFSVRGFEPRALGPTIPTLRLGDPSSASTDFTIGGNKQAIFNLELEFDILEAAGIKGVLFADAGNAYSDEDPFFAPGFGFSPSGERISLPGGMFYSLGFGFRWFSPLGPLRFEWGFPLTKKRPQDDNMVFEFTIGNFF